MNSEYLFPIEQALKDFSKSEAFSAGDSKRIFHGRGGLFPGLQWCVIDAFAPTLFVTLFDSPPEGFESDLLGLFQCHFAELGGFTRLGVQYRHEHNAPVQWLLGEEPEAAIAKRGDMNFHIRFSKKNIGYFLDMEPGRQWLEQRVLGRSVLNLFAYTCAFSIVAQASGAKKVVNVDMSSQALNIGRNNHHLNNQSTENVQFMGLDILKSWSRIRKPGPYDVIIIDPPSFQKGSFVAQKDYAKVVRRIYEFAEQGADILACLNAPELDCQFLIDVFAEFAPQCHFMGRLPWSPDFKDIDEQRQLKLLHFVYEAKN